VKILPVASASRRADLGLEVRNLREQRGRCRLKNVGSEPRQQLAGVHLLPLAHVDERTIAVPGAARESWTIARPTTPRVVTT